MIALGGLFEGFFGIAQYAVSSFGSDTTKIANWWARNYNRDPGQAILRANQIVRERRAYVFIPCAIGIAFFILAFMHS